MTQTMKLGGKTPCNECPWRRSSPAGYFAEHSWEEYAQLARFQIPTACHKTVGEGREPTLCVGMAQMLNNSCSTPRDPAHAVEVAAAGKNPEVFRWLHEAAEHHAEANAKWLARLQGEVKP